MRVRMPINLDRTDLRKAAYRKVYKAWCIAVLVSLIGSPLASSVAASAYPASAPPSVDAKPVSGAPDSTEVQSASSRISASRDSLERPVPRVGTRRNISETKPASGTAPDGVFVENVGQFDPRVKFQGYIGDKRVIVTSTGIWISVATPLQTGKTNPSVSRPSIAVEEMRASVSDLRLTFPGSLQDSVVSRFDRSPIASTYISADDDSPRTLKPHSYRGVRFDSIYPGWSLEITAPEGKLSWSMIATSSSGKIGQPNQPLSGGHPIRMSVEGQDGMELAGDSLLLDTPDREIK